MAPSPQPLPHVMNPSNVADRLQNRQRAAQLIEAVLAEEIEPRIAINRWPESPLERDPSLDCAYQALWHFEADETQQQSELFYLDAQLELLRQMALFLSSGKDLPAYMLAQYTQQSSIRFFYALPIWKDYLQKINAAWRQFQQICKAAWEVGFPGNRLQK